MDDDLRLRIAAMDDCAALASIYRPYVEKTPITFEYDAPNAKEFQRRMRITLEHFPYLVCESSKDGIVGYAYGGMLYDRAAYRWDAELSIYVSLLQRGKGIGSALYRALLQLLKLQGYCRAYACVTYPNDESVEFHKRFGFQLCGHFPKSGFKFGQWHDVIWMDKPLIMSDDGFVPEIPKAVKDLERAAVTAILTKAIKGE